MIKTALKISEDVLQRQCMSWINLQYPNAMAFHVPNGGLRNVRVAVKLKAQGVRAGVLDICIPVVVAPFHGAWIELKVGKNKPTIEQLAMMLHLRTQGYFVSVCYTFEAFVATVNHYLEGAK